MIVLLDANVLLRLSEPGAALYSTAYDAVAILQKQGFVLHCVPQSIYEFRVVATRPIVNNGLGLSIAETESEIASILSFFPLIDDASGLFAEWRTLVTSHRCHGKIAHDARIVAAMQTHGLTHLLTFNVGDFTRFPNITILDPKAIAAGFTVP